MDIVDLRKLRGRFPLADLNSHRLYIDAKFLPNYEL